MKEFIQEFKRAVRGSRYQEKVLVDECATNLDRYWRESRKEERLRGRKENRNQEQRQRRMVNNQERFRPRPLLSQV